MNDPVLMQVISAQNSILEEIKQMRRMDEARALNTNVTSTNTPIASTSPMDFYQPSEYTGMSNGNNSAFSPSQYYDMTPNEMPPTMSAQLNPVSHRNLVQTDIFDVTNMTNSTIEDVFKFDASRMSKEASQEFIANRSQSLQLGTVNTVASSSALIGGGAGMLMGGLLPSLAVGALVGGGVAYAGNSMVEGAKDSLQFQDILRRDGYKAYNAFESTSRYGGIGMNLEEQQDISSYLRDLSNETYLTNDEMSVILQGSLDNRLLKSVKDATQFKDRMKELVDSVKQVSVLLDESLEESVKFLGEMERRGIGSKEGLQIGSQIKAGASMLGMDASTYSNVVFQQTDAITSNTAMDNAKVMGGITTNSYLVEAISEVSKQGNEQMYNYIKNSGGASAVAGNIEAQLRGNFQNNDLIQKQLLAFIAPAMVQDGDGFTIDNVALDKILNSEKDLRTLLSDSAAYTKQLSASELSVMANSVGSVANNNLNSADMIKVYKMIQDSFTSEYGVTGADALLKMGLTSNFEDAELLNQALLTGSDENVQRQINSKGFKELMDTGKIANSPSLEKQAKFWWRRNVTDPLEDVGAGISDSIGSMSEDLQMWSKNIEDMGIIGGDIVSDFSKGTMDDFFYGDNSYINSFYKNLRNLDSYKEYEEYSDAVDKGKRFDAKNVFENNNFNNERALSGLGGIEEGLKGRTNALSGGEFNSLVDGVKKGEVTASQLQQFQEMLDDPNVRESAKDQYRYLLNMSEGKYDKEGFWGKIGAWSQDKGHYVGARLNIDAIRDFDFDFSFKPGEYEFSSLELIEKEEKKLTKEGKKLHQELNKKLTKSNLDPADLDLVQQAIASGDTEAISHIYLDSDLKDVQDRYAKYNQKIENMGNTKDQYFAIQGTVNTYGKATQGAYAFLQNSGVYTDVEFDSYFKDTYEDIKKVVDKMPKMDNEELAEAYEDIKSQAERSFDSLSTARKEQLADALVSNNIVDNVSNLYKENSNQIDAAKLLAALQNEGRYAMSGENAAETVLTDGKVTTAMEEHKSALNTLTDGIIEEVSMLGDAVMQLKRTSQGRNITSINS